MEDKKYLITVEGLKESYELPIYATSLEEATLKSQEYEDAGFEVTRIRPEVK